MSDITYFIYYSLYSIAFVTEHKALSDIELAITEIAFVGV